MRFTRLLAAAVTGVAALSLAAVPAAAHDQEYAPTMLVLDASGSMKQADPGGGTKMDAARTAMRTLITAAPDESKVGLTVYGTGTGSSDAEKAAGCQDVKVLRAADTIDKGGLTAAVDGVTPKGYTPIGTALRKAADSLPKSGPRSIVLVSDGEDTCAPPEPCEVAKELNQQGAKIVMHAVGFGVDAKARKQLTCIAQNTGGTYTDAPDGKSLERVLPRVTATALRNYKPSGTPITGTATYDTAPVAAPGQYLDTIGQKEKRYYAVDVPQGATAYFSGTLSFPRVRNDNPNGDTSSLNVRVYGADGADCHQFDFESVVNSSHGAALTVAKTWDGATKQKTGSVSGDKCKGGGRYYFALEWSGVANGMPERLPIELLAGVEPAVTDAGPPAATTMAAFTEPNGAKTPVTGGGSFNVAGTLGGSGSYTDTLQRGEFVFYRVKVDWGQGLAYRVHYAETGNRGLESLSNATTTLYTPFREELDHNFTSYTGSATVMPTGKPALATLPVRYNNRASEDTKARNQSVAGWYYIAVKLGPTRDGGSTNPVPIRLDVTLTGDAEPGPAYAFGSADAQRNGTFGEGGVPASGGTDQPAEVGTTATATNSAVSTSGWVVIAVAGGVVLLALVLGGVLLRRRRA
ncbi:vWA domain-containing protein [Allokutzneria oryzae]|uniref:VWA domain-containing protein n=1 Tax=Allokutzneria oryzae TaxID=1378989 RepID=A0ABV6A7N8_9PSEU